MINRYSGELRLDENQFHSLGEGKVIFVCAQNDLFSKRVPDKYIARILKHCRKYSNNQYFFQTKNPKRMFKYLESVKYRPEYKFIKKQIFCATIETNHKKLCEKYSGGIRLFLKYLYSSELSDLYRFQITIEPIMEFDYEDFYNMILSIYPDQVNIGADSGNSDLPEPSWRKVQNLIARLENSGIKVWQKKNLERLKD